jgi:ribosomal protein S18 acetylase RimI-like enzyme
VEAVASLIAAQNQADYGHPLYTADDLRALWQSSKLDLAHDTWVLVAPDGSHAGYAALQDGFALIYLADRQPAEALGAHLLNAVEARARSLALDVLRTRLGDSKPGLRRAFESAGYVLRLSFLMMEIEMDTPPAPPQWADGLTVRTFVRGRDEQATYLADEAASQDKGYSEPMTFEAWAERMGLNGSSFDSSLWHLACEGQEVVGVSLTAYSKETHEGWVNHLGVRRAWRRQGAGLALLLHSFGEFYRRGVRKVKLSVDSQSLTNAPRLYERAGMRTVQQYHIYRKNLIPPDDVL